MTIFWKRSERELGWIFKQVHTILVSDIQEEYPGMCAGASASVRHTVGHLS